VAPQGLSGSPRTAARSEGRDACAAATRASPGQSAAIPRPCPHRRPPRRADGDLPFGRSSNCDRKTVVSFTAQEPRRPISHAGQTMATDSALVRPSGSRSRLDSLRGVQKYFGCLAALSLVSLRAGGVRRTQGAGFVGNTSAAASRVLWRRLVMTRRDG
jgi:hypothetical protein